MLLPVNYSISIKAIGNTGKKTTARTGFLGFFGDTHGRDLFLSLNQYGPFRKGTRKQVQILFSLAFVLLLSAIFNYINLTVSQTSKRVHEMATRRLMGDSAGQIVLRYLAESAIFTTGCFIGGCLVAVITKPYFSTCSPPGSLWSLHRRW